MSEISWDNPDMKKICGECHFKDADPELCHGIEPPIKKPFVPQNISVCFLFESLIGNVCQKSIKREWKM